MPTEADSRKWFRGARDAITKALVAYIKDNPLDTTCAAESGFHPMIMLAGPVPEDARNLKDAVNGALWNINIAIAFTKEYETACKIISGIAQLAGLDFDRQTILALDTSKKAAPRSRRTGRKGGH